MGDDKYRCFADLAAAQQRGEDFDFETRRTFGSTVVIIAPHGGTIEPLTDKIAKTIAGDDFSVYCFRALKRGSGLHITSHLFDEPCCVKLVGEHLHLVSIHGWGVRGERACVGGLDTQLIGALQRELVLRGIKAEVASGHLTATEPENITNRGSSGRGVQFELTMDFRKNAATIEKFVAGVRKVLLDLRPDE